MKFYPFCASAGLLLLIGCTPGLVPPSAPSAPSAEPRAGIESAPVAAEAPDAELPAPKPPAAVSTVPAVGYDLGPVFRTGKPVTYVAIGGSITQAGQGWIAGPLGAARPGSRVVNAGMSATGSELGIFRIGKDVIDRDPDVVLIEFAVNDGGLSDEDAVRYVESLIVRLKTLPKPPAVILFRAAARPAARDRLKRLADHYRLLYIDSQTPLETKIAATGTAWEKWMTDSVHPNEDGHRFYGELIWRALQPYLESDASRRPPYLPPPLSAKPLILDGACTELTKLPVAAAAAGWRNGSEPRDWWKRFFPSAVWADGPGAVLKIPFKARFGGVLYLLDAGRAGQFYLTLDGGAPQFVDCAYRGGYEYRVPGKDLSPDTGHELALVTDARSAGPVGVGWLLTAGHEGAFDRPVPRGPYSPEKLKALVFEPIPASAWEWSGPYGGTKSTLESIADLDAVFAPEKGGGEWKSIVQPGDGVDFVKLGALFDRGVSYLRTTLNSETGGERNFRWRLDYFGKIWVNGKLIFTVRDGHGGPHEPITVRLPLQPGTNEILLKIHSGSGGNKSALEIEKNETK